ncbi:MAG TPA: hypothetical protein VNL77_03455 [Roseiflexaceae bacterium]|nr:hypothetical protein [Roseiflexaceae bacterium]
MEVRVDEKGKFFTPRIAKDAVAAFVRTRDQVIVGAIYVRPGNRLTDELNSDAAPFLPITDAQVYRADDERLLYRAGLLMVAYHDIVLIGELDAMAEIRPAPWQLGQPEHEPQPPSADIGLRVDEKGKFFSVRVPKDALHVLAHAADMMLAGYMYLRPERRLRDELNEARTRFLPITEARVFHAASERQLYHASFLLAAYAHIASLSPMESLADARPAPWLSQLPEEATP